MKSRFKLKLLLFTISFSLFVILIWRVYQKISVSDMEGLILEKDDGGVLYLENNQAVNLDGLLGSVAFSPDGSKGIYFREDENGETEIAEITFADATVRIVADAETLQKCMSDEEVAHDNQIALARPKSIKYAMEENTVSFIRDDALYKMNLKNNAVDCIIEKLGQTTLAAEGQDYVWLSDREIVYETADEKGINCIVKYNLQTKETQFVHYGSGIRLSENGDLICYESYIKNSTTWEHYNEFTLIDADSLEVKKSYTYKRVCVFLAEGSITFWEKEGEKIAWYEQGKPYFWIYDFENGKRITQKILSL